MDIDAHARPPDHVRAVHRQHLKASASSPYAAAICDPIAGQLAGFQLSSRAPETLGFDSANLINVCAAFTELDSEYCHTADSTAVYEHPAVPGIFIPNLWQVHDRFTARLRQMEMVGLFIFPSLIPVPVQIALLDRLLHRDLSNPVHKTNLHAHYEMTYPRKSVSGPSSFFADDKMRVLQPLDTAIHKPLRLHLALSRKLRWMTLGGQYDWTRKCYPSRPAATPTSVSRTERGAAANHVPSADRDQEQDQTHDNEQKKQAYAAELDAFPEFPPDMAALVNGLFRSITPQAAICNVYSPGDTLAPHRDVSEACARPLVSISLGCSGLFVVGLDGGSHGLDTETESEVRSDDGPGGDRSEGGPETVTIRLRSGDVVVMSGPARTAWHGVPRIEAGSCSAELVDWPCLRRDAGMGTADGVDAYTDTDADVDTDVHAHASVDDRYRAWKGWMAGKRVNLNIRQMYDVV